MYSLPPLFMSHFFHLTTAPIGLLLNQSGASKLAQANLIETFLYKSVINVSMTNNPIPARLRKGPQVGISIGITSRLCSLITVTRQNAIPACNENITRTKSANRRLVHDSS